MYFRKHGTTGKSIFEYISRFFAGDKIRPREDSIRSLEKSRRNGKKGKWDDRQSFSSKGKEELRGDKILLVYMYFVGDKNKNVSTFV